MTNEIWMIAATCDDRATDLSGSGNLMLHITRPDHDLELVTREKVHDSQIKPHNANGDFTKGGCAQFVWRVEEDISDIEPNDVVLEEISGGGWLPKSILVLLHYSRRFEILITDNGWENTSPEKWFTNGSSQDKNGKMFRRAYNLGTTEPVEDRSLRTAGLII